MLGLNDTFEHRKCDVCKSYVATAAALITTQQACMFAFIQVRSLRLFVPKSMIQLHSVIYFVSLFGCESVSVHLPGVYGTHVSMLSPSRMVWTGR